MKKENSARSLNHSIDNYSASAKTSTKAGKYKMLAFGAAAAGGLLASSQAEADIVYSGPVNIDIPFPTNTVRNTFGIDFDGNSAPDVTLAHVNVLFHPNPQYQNTGVGLNVIADLGFQLGGTTNGYNFPNEGVPSSGSFAVGSGVAGGGYMGWSTVGTAVTNTDPWGVFANASVSQVGIFGVSFNGVTASGGTAPLAGWVRLALHSEGGPSGATTMTIVDYAYENMGNPIHLGAVPEPGSMGIFAMATLALGAAGIRRRRKVAK